MRLGVPIIDVAIDGKSGLGRVNGYASDPDEACIECSLDPDRYATAGKRLPCQAADAPSTAAPLHAGASVAAWQASETDKLLSGRAELSLLGRQLYFDTQHHQHFVTRFERNPDCRLDHVRWSIEIIDTDPAAMTLADLFALEVAGTSPTSIAAYRQAFLRRLACTGCAWQGHPTLILQERLPVEARHCPDCQEPVIGAAGAVDYALTAADVSADDLAVPLAAIGFEPGDVVTLADGDWRRHVQLGHLQSGKSR